MEMSNYLQKEHLVSAECRLDLNEQVLYSYLSLFFFLLFSFSFLTPFLSSFLRNSFFLALNLSLLSSPKEKNSSYKWKGTKKEKKKGKKEKKGEWKRGRERKQKEKGIESKGGEEGGREEGMVVVLCLISR